MSKNKEKRPVGRPRKFTKELAIEICKQIAVGESLRNICKAEEMPDRGTVHEWLVKTEPEYKEFYHQYEAACNTRAENMFDELNDIADDGTNDFMQKLTTKGEPYEVVNGENIARSRLRVDTRKWYLSKVLPKKFGEKIDVTTAGDKIPGTLSPEALKIAQEYEERIQKEL